MTALRKSRPGDVRELRKLWEIVFGPEEAFTEVFFREVYRPGSAAVAEENGVIVSAAYGVDFGTDRYIYAVGTHPAHRGRGLGKAVTLLAAGGGPAYLCPTNEKLRNWYVREMGAECACRRPIFDPPGELRAISAGEYAGRRERLLAGRPHAVYTPEVLELFALYGTFYAEAGGGIRAMEGDETREALPCRFGEEPYILSLNGAPPIYWGLTLE